MNAKTIPAVWPADMFAHLCRPVILDLDFVILFQYGVPLGLQCGYGLADFGL